MCLSTVYLDEKKNDKVLAREVTIVSHTDGGVEVRTLFGERASAESYLVGEVNLTENYVILRRKGSDANG